MTTSKLIRSAAKAIFLCAASGLVPGAALCFAEEPRRRGILPLPPTTQSPPQQVPRGKCVPHISQPPIAQSPQQTAPAEKKLHPASATRPLMGTRFTIQLYAPDEATARAATEAAFAEAARLEAIFSDYQPDSELSRFNRAPANTPVPLSPDLYRILESSLQIARDSDGAFDPTLGRLTQLWRQSRQTKQLPPENQLAAARAASGFQNLRLDPDAKTATKLVRRADKNETDRRGDFPSGEGAMRELCEHNDRRATHSWGESDRLQPTPAGKPNTQPSRSVSVLSGFRTTPGLALDLGGIAKGYTADQMLATLRQHGITRAAITAGGDIRAGDPPPDKPGWPLTLHHGENQTTPPQQPLANAAASNSGELHQFLEINGTRYSHILDPTTGLGATNSRTTTVIAPNATLSDALSTATRLLPPEKHQPLLKKHPNTHVITSE